MKGPEQLRWDVDTLDTQAVQFAQKPDKSDYAAFVEKFQPKKTTDDCYTPPEVYDAVASWVEREYGIARKNFLRPFYPGGDYRSAEYPPGCAVVDNPPFSILAEIKKIYCARNILFFLFAPTLTLFASGDAEKLTYLPCGAKITYENGAVVNTSFVTNMDGDYILRTTPDLLEAIDQAQRRARKEKAKQMPRYQYPAAVCTAASICQLSQHGTRFAVRRREARFIRELDAQKGHGKTIFGGRCC